jgi:membrane protease YdiL (CAAX protease family)
LKPPTSPGGGDALAAVIRTHPLLAFFALAFLISWAIWVPLALDRYSLLPSRIPEGLVIIGRLLGTLGPAIAASLIARTVAGRPGVKALWGQLGRWRVAWTWYAASGLVFPALLFLASWLYRLSPEAAPLPTVAVSMSSLVVTAIVLTISVLGEEIGWRGFALPRIQGRRTALGASLILGAIWTVWHLPFWVVLGELEQFGPSYWLLSWLWITAGSVYLTWIMNNTGNSLPMALLFHWGYNMLSVGFLPLSSIVPAYLILVALGWAVVVGVVGVYGPKRLARTR